MNIWNTREEIASHDELRKMLYRLTCKAVMETISADRGAQWEDAAAFGDDPQSEEKILVEMLVATMPDTQKEIYRMSYAEGKTAAQIAEALKMPEDQVEKLLNEAAGEVRSVLSVFKGLQP